MPEKRFRILKWFDYTVQKNRLAVFDIPAGGVLLFLGNLGEKYMHTKKDLIHQFQQGDDYIVLDIASGSIHVVDDVTSDIIGLWAELEKDEITEKILEKYSNRDDVTREETLLTFEQIEILINGNKLFSDDRFVPNIEKLKPKTQVLKAMCLHVAHTCNLTCDYCFARQGQFCGEKALMSFDTGKQSLDFLIENSGTHRNLEVDFFGGEPLLNWEVVKQLVAYAREQEKVHNKNFRFTLTTNGVLLNDEVMEFSNREMQNVVLSLDGRKEVHDRLRRLGNGQGSYDVIVPAFQDFVAKRGKGSYYIRGTFTHFNRDFTNDIQHMLDLGFRELSMEPVVSAPDDPYALSDKDLPQLFGEYEKLMNMMNDSEKKSDPFHFYHYTLDLAHGPCIYKRLKGCGSGTEYVAVTPWGELFPCHQFVGYSAYSMGNVYEGILRPEICEEFSHCNVYENEECQKCWARLYCSGGCAANAYHATGSVRGIYGFGCELFKKRMEYAIALQVLSAAAED
jgi:six-Cys-in-45 modification radical SAM protein